MMKKNLVPKLLRSVFLNQRQTEKYMVVSDFLDCSGRDLGSKNPGFNQVSS
jgi:hypothetical protein